MNRVESHIIRNSKELDELSFCSKNLYNRANYIIRQKFIETSKLKEQGLVSNAIYLNYNEIEKELKSIEDFNLLSSQTRQSILRLLDKNWRSFFSSIKDWSNNKNKYKGKPNLPKYLDKTGRNILIYPGQNIFITKGFLKVPKSSIKVKTKISKSNLKEVRIISQGNRNFKIEVVYNKELKDLCLPKSRVFGIDIGLNNLLAITSNQIDVQNYLLNGRPLKSINQFYNKRLSELKSVLEIVNGCKKSKSIISLNFKRKNKINDYLHKTSRTLINLCIDNNIGKIVIGHNVGWKQDISIGKRNNQNFVQIPFNKLIQMIQYKAEDVGIEVFFTEESYTSKIDHLALEEMKHQENYLGKRIKRGLFKSSLGVELNADINGAIGMLRKTNEVSTEFLKTLGNRGCVSQPIKLNC